ncbi:hypothetical protein [Kibdelosporangium philippinense]|uniref:hypothetical protein n=1 Tax=Kibdelosporangium philippinense TaxID=211113 RepID=UPI00360C976F
MLIAVVADIHHSGWGNAELSAISQRRIARIWSSAASRARAQEIPRIRGGRQSAFQRTAAAACSQVAALASTPRSTFVLVVVSTDECSTRRRGELHDRGRIACAACDVWRCAQYSGRPHPGVRILPRYFEQTRERCPDDIAVVCGSSHLSF